MNVILASSLSIVPPFRRKRQRSDECNLAALVGQPVATSFANKKLFVETLSKLGYAVVKSHRGRTIWADNSKEVILYNEDVEGPDIARTKHPYEILAKNHQLISEYFMCDKHPRPQVVQKLLPPISLPGLPIIFQQGTWLWSILLQYTVEYGMSFHLSRTSHIPSHIFPLLIIFPHFSNRFPSSPLTTQMLN